VEGLLKKLLFRLPNGGCFLYGNYARELMIKEGFNPDKLYTIHNSLAYDDQVKVRKQLLIKPVYKDHFRNESPNLFFVGRLTKIKKLDMVLKAMAQLKETGKQFNMTFIGGGSVQGELEELAEELGIKENVWFYGPSYDEKVLGEMIFNADLCVSPGNIGLTAMHSLVFGTPAITHDDFPHQMPEFEAIIDGKTGTFFKNGSIDSLAEGIARWFDKHKNDREDVRKACMKEIDENWTPQFQLNVLRDHLR
jgi:glycosyltransferase involved in cell wall biosynthesis